jgi:hypothetical protein
MLKIADASAIVLDPDSQFPIPAEITLILPQTNFPIKNIGKIISEFQVTVAWFTSRLFDVLVDHQLDDLAPLKLILFGGEPHSFYHVERAFRNLPAQQRAHRGNFTLKNPKAPPFTCSAQLNKISIPLGQKAQIMAGLASSPISKSSPSPVDTSPCSNSAKSNPSLIISTRYSAKYQKPHQSRRSHHHPKSENKKPVWFAQLTQNSLKPPCFSSSDPLTI